VLCVLVVTTPTYGQTQATAKAADSPPQWAYPENNSNYKPAVDDGKPVRVPNSTAGYTWTQLQAAIAALFRVINGTFGNLPPMPGVFYRLAGRAQALLLAVPAYHPAPIHRGIFKPKL
jgi:hypothetical protein